MGDAPGTVITARACSRALIALAVTVLVACASPAPEPTATGSEPVAAETSPPPSPRETPEALQIGDLVSVPVGVAGGVDPGAAAGKSLNVPEGWSADVWANVPGARLAAWTPDGRLLAAGADANAYSATLIFHFYYHRGHGGHAPTAA